MNQTTAKDIDAYIARFPAEVQAILQKIRQTIRETVPEAKEVISYQMPAFYLQGNLVYYVAWKNHIGFYRNYSAGHPEASRAIPGGKRTIAARDGGVPRGDT